MIKHLDIYQLASLHDQPRHFDVFGRGGRVAGGVVVDDDEGRAVQLDGLAEEFAHPHDAGVEAADVNGGGGQVVDVRDQPCSRHVPHFNREGVHLLVGGETGFGRLERVAAPSTLLRASAVALKE